MGKFENYLHDFAVWTAARASQRGFVKTEIISNAINSTHLKDLAHSSDITSPSKFDDFHIETCQTMMRFWDEYGVKNGTYGRAAKVTNIYCKTAMVIPNTGKGALSKIIHPPIDRVLLQNVKKRHKKLSIKSISWTRFDQAQYFDIIEKLRTLPFDHFWEIEAEYWNPH